MTEKLTEGSLNFPKTDPQSAAHDIFFSDNAFRALIENPDNLFSKVTITEWEQCVEKSLKGGKVAEKLAHKTLDDILIKPLYPVAPKALDTNISQNTATSSEENGVCHKILAKNYAALKKQGKAGENWVAKFTVEHPSAKICNQLILSGLQHGASALELKVAGSLSKNHSGVWLFDDEQLSQCFSNVHCEMLDVSLDAYDNFYELNCYLEKKESIDLNLSSVYLKIEPWRLFTEKKSRYNGNFQNLLANCEPLIKRSQKKQRSLFKLSSALIHNAGGTQVQEVAFMAGAFSELLRQFANYLKDPPNGDLLLNLLDFEMAVGSEFFLEVAKLRATKVVLLRLLEAAFDQNPALELGAITSQASLSIHDPWVNLLRSSEQSLVAVLGGCNKLNTLPFDYRITPAGSLFGLRMALNTQNLLAEECHAGRVHDPLAGSPYIEQLTQEITEKSWDLFQKWEQNGGLLHQLTSGQLQQEVDKKWQTKKRNFASRKAPILGTSEYADLQEKMPDADIPFLFEEFAAQVAKARTSTEPIFQNSGHFPFDCPSSHEERKILPSFPVNYQTAEYDKLRAWASRRAQQTGHAPSVSLICFGSPASIAARTAWIEGIFAAGGFVCKKQGVLNTTSATENFALEHPTEPVVVIVASDSAYVEFLGAYETHLAGLASVGKKVYLAGNPNTIFVEEKDKAFFNKISQNWLSGSIFLGCAVTDFLQEICQSYAPPLGQTALVQEFPWNVQEDK